MALIVSKSKHLADFPCNIAVKNGSFVFPIWLLGKWHGQVKWFGLDHMESLWQHQQFGFCLWSPRPVSETETHSSSPYGEKAYTALFIASRSFKRMVIQIYEIFGTEFFPTSILSWLTRQKLSTRSDRLRLYTDITARSSGGYIGLKMFPWFNSVIK